MRACLFIATALIITGCGDSKYPSTTLPDPSQWELKPGDIRVPRFSLELDNPLKDHSYEIGVPGKCTTGLKKFNSEKETCEGLLNHKLNHDCANRERYELFMKYCEPRGYVPYGEKRKNRGHFSV